MFSPLNRSPASPGCSAALALLARHEHVGQEVHLDHLGALALARLAAAALDVEGEPAGLVAADLRFLGQGEDLPDEVEDAWCTWPGSSAACGRWATGQSG